MAKGEDKEDGPATEGSAPPSPAKKPWRKPSMWASDGAILHEIKSGETVWSNFWEDDFYRPMS